MLRCIEEGNVLRVPVQNHSVFTEAHCVCIRTSLKIIGKEFPDLL